MRRALIVGIDHYSFGPLTGCVNDARAMDDLLQRDEDGTKNFDTRLLVSESTTITRASLKEEVNSLFATGAEDVEIALLYFAGHGTETNLGGYLVTSDAATYDEGVSLVDVLALANASAAREVVILLDSCMSGALGALPAIGGDAALAHLREGIAILTASRSGQVSVEVGGRGLFTQLVCSALEGGAADVLGHVTVASIYAYVEEALGAWDQRPLFKAHLSKLVPVRRVRPAVDLAILRELPTIFPDPTRDHPLDPSFEPEEESRIEENVIRFRKLQKCRAAKLVEPVGYEDMYWAAINSTGCRLTPMGRRYWRMAQEARL